MSHSMEFSENVLVLERDDKTWYIIGTAHVSQNSVEEVKQVIDAVQPDTICVELCEMRHKSLTDDSVWKKLNIFDVIKQKKMLYLLTHLSIGAFQRRLGDKLGVKPGAELMAGVEKAKEIDATLVLADRDIQVTLKRTWRNLSFFKKFQVLGGITGSLFSNEEISPAELEKLKEKDHLSDMMQEFAKVLPEIQKPLIDERDQYLMSKIEEAPGQKIVAVVGAGHVQGMQTYFGKQIDRASISVIPPASKWVPMLKWIIPFLVLAAFTYGVNKTAGQGWQELLTAWILPNSIACALLTALARGKFLSIVTAFIASPITSLNPALGAGMAVGLVEAWLRKPTVEDCENINEDVKDFRGIFKNRFTHVLAVAVAANLGSAIGAYVGISWLISKIL